MVHRLPPQTFQSRASDVVQVRENRGTDSIFSSDGHELHRRLLYAGGFRMGPWGKILPWMLRETYWCLAHPVRWSKVAWPELPMPQAAPSSTDRSRNGRGDGFYGVQSTNPAQWGSILFHIRHRTRSGIRRPRIEGRRSESQPDFHYTLDRDLRKFRFDSGRALGGAGASLAGVLQIDLQLLSPSRPVRCRRMITVWLSQ
jgi:hypothetical protein